VGTFSRSFDCQRFIDDALTTEGVLQSFPLAPSSAAMVTPGPARPRRSASGFTLVELLVVIGIIVVLITILLPVVHKIRIAAQVADTKSFVSELTSAIERYQQDFKAYPGPLKNDEMDLGDTSITYLPTGFASFGYPITLPTGYDCSTQTPAQLAKNFTMSENLVLGLLGGLHIDTTSTSGNEILDYDPSAVGGGPTGLSTFASANNSRHAPYLDSKQLSWTTGANGKTGHFHDAGGDANDSVIPCFLDRFTDPMPILYMRAKVGANPAAGAVSSATPYGPVYNPIVTDDFSEVSAPTTTTPPLAYAVRAGQYDISQIIGYTGAFTGSGWPNLTRDTAIPPTGTSIGIGKSPNLSKYTVAPSGGNIYHGLQMLSAWSPASQYPPTTPSMSNQYPYDAYPYLVGSSGQVRQKDGYILISAGADRTYGTEDDICNFGDVNP
jgi:prepilin-type N-terminal cleavage/methylation domain-containing protein